MVNEIHLHMHGVYVRVLVVKPCKLGPVFPTGESRERALLCTVFAMSMNL